MGWDSYLNLRLRELSVKMNRLTQVRILSRVGSRSVSASARASASGNGSTTKHDKEDAMPTPRSLGFDLTYQKCGDTDAKSRKLAIVAGWMGAKQRQLRPYINFYHNRGYDVLSYAVGPGHVLKPSTATAMMAKVIDIATDTDDKTPEHDHIVMHCFSVGGYLTGQMLRILSESKNSIKMNKLHSMIKAQVYDSPPDMRSIPNGIGASMGLGPVVASTVASIVRSYLYLVRNSAGIEHQASSDAFHNNHIPAPSLWFYSKSDPVALEEDIDTVMSKWKTMGKITDSTVWIDSPHIQHARKDPERYFGSLAEFIDRHTNDLKGQ